MTRKIHRNVWLLSLTSFITDASSEVINPILPFFIASLGGGATAIGLIGGLGESVASLLKVFSGYFADKSRKKRPFVIAGYGLSASLKLLFTLATSWTHVALIVPLERVGKGIRVAPRDALIAHSTPKHLRGKAFGIQKAFDTAGALLGTLLAIYLWFYLGLSFQTIFVVAAAIAFVGLLPLFLVKEAEHEPQNKLSLLGNFNALPRNLKWFILAAAIFAVANFSYMFLILKAGESFQGADAILFPLALYAFYSLVLSTAAIPVGNLADKYGRKRILGVGYACFALTTLGFAFTSGFLPLLLFFALYGVFHACVDGVQRAFVSDCTHEKNRATALGYFHTSVSVAALPGGLAAGMLADAYGLEATFLFGACLALVAFVLLEFKVREP